MNRLSTIDLNRVLKRNDVTKHVYIGSFPACIIPKTRKKRYFFITNTDQHDGPGKHWTAWMMDGDKAEFFDSFGRSPENLGFLQFLEKHAKTWQYNNICVQSMLSGVCGQHVICFFLYIQKMSAWLKLFHSSLIINDETVHSMIENKFKIKAPLYPDIQIFT